MNHEENISNLRTIIKAKDGEIATLTAECAVLAEKVGAAVDRNAVMTGDLAAAQLPAQGTVMDEALDLLDAIYSQYENGEACYEDADECQGYLGNAFELDGETEHKILHLLNAHRPKQASLAAPAQQPTDSAAQSGDEGVA